jgi:molybdopterin converting factor small subunit
MKVTVRLLGGLGSRAPTSPLEVEIRQNATVAEVVERLGLRPGEVWLATLNGQLVAEGHLLQAGDELSLIPPIGGG